MRKGLQLPSIATLTRITSQPVHKSAHQVYKLNADFLNQAVEMNIRDCNRHSMAKGLVPTLVLEHATCCSTEL